MSGLALVTVVEAALIGFLIAGTHGALVGLAIIFGLCFLVTLIMTGAQTK